jgi:hypothetical protein
MNKRRISYNYEMGFWCAGLCIVLLVVNNSQARETNNLAESTLQVLQNLLPSTNVAWDAESKTTSAVAGLGNAEFIFCFQWQTTVRRSVTFGG